MRFFARNGSLSIKRRRQTCGKIFNEFFRGRREALHSLQALETLFVRNCSAGRQAGREQRDKQEANELCKQAPSIKMKVSRARINLTNNLSH